MNELAEAVRGWVPQPETAVVTLDRRPADAFAALLDQPPPSGDHLPPLWHWLYFLEHPRSDELSEDGHPTSGHFLPPIPRRRRMFAGGRVELRAPLRRGTRVRRDSRIGDIVAKTGRSGEMLFVTERRPPAVTRPRRRTRSRPFPMAASGWCPTRGCSSGTRR